MTKELFTDNHPNTSIKGFGFSNSQKAKDTINKLKKFDKNYQKQVIITMYYRAKYHPHHNENMKKAMIEFKKGAIKLKLNIKLN